MIVTGERSAEVARNATQKAAGLKKIIEKKPRSEKQKAADLRQSGPRKAVVEKDVSAAERKAANRRANRKKAAAKNEAAKKAAPKNEAAKKTAPKKEVAKKRIVENINGIEWVNNVLCLDVKWKIGQDKDGWMSVKDLIEEIGSNTVLVLMIKYKATICVTETWSALYTYLFE
jgi:hypothetical protein